MVQCGPQGEVCEMSDLAFKAGLHMDGILAKLPVDDTGICLYIYIDISMD